MRHTLSLLTGISVSGVCLLFLHQASSLSLLALGICGIGICLVTRAWAYNLPVLRRAGVRLRIFWRRHAAIAVPVTVEPGPFFRRQLERVNFMWLSYALIAGWAFYEMLDVSRYTGAPIERAAAGASSAIDAVAGTSAAIRALSAVGDAPQSGELAAGLTAAALPKGSEADRVMVTTHGGAPVMGGTGPCEARPVDTECGVTSRRCGCASPSQSMLEAFLPEPPVKEF